jgi:hypothetical protein
MVRLLEDVFLALTLLVFLSPSSLYAQADAKKRSAKNLQQLALGIINYADAHKGNMPPAMETDKDGKPLCSWRVLILPYIGENKLYKQFKLDEPWDSEHNKKLLEEMPKVFAPVVGKTKEKHASFYQVVVGRGALFQPDGRKAGLPHYPASITDGTSNTILIVEADEAVPWTKPADVTYEHKKPLPKFGGLFKDGFHAAFADGSVRFIGKNADKDTLRAAITPSGGEVVDLEKLK